MLQEEKTSAHQPVEEQPPFIPRGPHEEKATRSEATCQKTGNNSGAPNDTDTHESRETYVPGAATDKNAFLGLRPQQRESGPTSSIELRTEGELGRMLRQSKEECQLTEASRKALVGCKKNGKLNQNLKGNAPTPFHRPQGEEDCKRRTQPGQQHGQAQDDRHRETTSPPQEDIDTHPPNDLGIQALYNKPDTSKRVATIVQNRYSREILTVLRHTQIAPGEHIRCLTLPGGKVDTQDKGNLAKAAARELWKETGLRIPHEQLTLQSTIDRTTYSRDFLNDSSRDRRGFCFIIALITW